MVAIFNMIIVAVVFGMVVQFEIIVVVDVIIVMVVEFEGHY